MNIINYNGILGDFSPSLLKKKKFFQITIIRENNIMQS